MKISRHPLPASRLTDRQLADYPGNGTGLSIGSPDWREVLLSVHGAIRRAVAPFGRQDTGETNAKGDAGKLFDVAANEAAISALREWSLPLLVDSEESDSVAMGKAPPRHRLILDPVDGSDNWARGLPLSAVSCAVIPMGKPLHPDGVEAAMIGPLAEGDPYLAQRGAGAWLGSTRIKVSAVRELSDALISIELNHFAPRPSVTRMMAGARGIRAYGCASRALTLVATGAIDAHVDVRGRLTPESFLAAGRLLIEAGGTVVGLDGKTLPEASRLTDRVDLIAASSRELCQDIVDRLGHARS